MQIKSNLYLHFLDRELRSSVDCQLGDKHIAVSTLGALCLAPGDVFLSLSHLWESQRTIGKAESFLLSLIQSKVLHPMSGHKTSEEFLDSRRKLYIHDKDRYSSYFLSKPPRQLIHLPKMVQLTSSSTKYLQTELLRWADTEALDENTNDLKGIVNKTVSERGNRAITSALFSPEIVRNSASGIKFLRRKISEEYTKHFLYETQSDIVTGVDGLEAYDHLARNRYYFDILVFKSVLSYLGLELRKEETLGGFSKLIRETRRSRVHLEFVGAYRSLLEGSALNLTKVLGNRGGLISSIGMRARSTKPVKEIRFDQLRDRLVSLCGVEPKIPLVRQETEMARVVLVVATPRELNALYEALHEKSYLLHDADLPGITAWKTDDISGCKLFVVKVDMGQLGVGASTLVTRDVIDAVKPQFVIMPGICFGMKERETKMLDILVAESLEDYENQKISKGKVINRGTPISSSASILTVSKEISVTRADVSHGPLISGSKLVNDMPFRNELVKMFPHALGGEMEGFGLASACERHKVSWLLTKAICDWGYDKDDAFQKKAAIRSCSYAVELVEGLARRAMFLRPQ